MFESHVPLNTPPHWLKHSSNMAVWKRAFQLWRSRSTKIQRSVTSGHPVWEASCLGPQQYLKTLTVYSCTSHNGCGGHCRADSGKWHIEKSYLDAICSLGLCAKGISATVPSAERHLCACSVQRDGTEAGMPACGVSVIADGSMPC